MTTTLSIRLARQEREALARLASQKGRTLSAFVREILKQALGTKSPRRDTRHLRGRLRLSQAAVDPWRRQIRERNWRR
jgi:hypothetical protein